MSYVDYQFEEKIVDSGYSGGSVTTNLVSGADLAVYGVSYQPIVVRAFAAIVTEALGTADATVELDHRPTANSDTGRTQVGVMTIPQSSASVGDVYYQDGISQKVVPGEEIVVETDGGASTNGAVDVFLFYQPAWEQPAANSSMNELTS